MSLDHNKLVDYQSKALVKFEEIGLPTKKSELWRGTDISLFYNKQLPVAERLLHVVMQKNMFDTIDATRLVFVNGYFHQALSDKIPEGVSFISLEEAVKTKDSSLAHIGSVSVPHEQPMVALNAINARDGAIIKIGCGVNLNKPIHLIFKNPVSGYTAYSRLMIMVDQYASAQFIAEHHTEMGSYENNVIEMILSDNARASILKTIDAVDAHYGALSCRLEAHSTLNIGYYGKGANLIRQETVVNLNGVSSNVNIGSACYVNNKKNHDNTCVVLHHKPHTTSSQLFKNIAADNGRISTRAKTIVAQNAQKTDGRQLLQSLLLSQNASSYAKPELEIYADDVKCSHGSTVGQLDKEALFYLRSRGIPLIEAKKLLTKAFINEALFEIIDAELLDIILNDFENYFR